MGDPGRGDQTISLPQGGGAIRGIGEKFSPDLHTGTGNFSIPITLPAGRNGLQPQLSLDYSTGNGNGPFGLGWTVNVPGVARKTSDGIPIYADDSDVFLLSGAEDLVPVRHFEGATRYRPRTEGLFADIVYYRDDANSFWRVRTKDGLVSVYGTPASHGTDPAVVADPANPRKCFAWRLTRTEDPFGNRIEYEYERDRTAEGPRHFDQLYLKKVRYGDYAEGATSKFIVTVQFDYELRPQDSFSQYRAGFEIRTRKRCSGIRTHTHAGSDRLVRSYHLTYADERPELRTALPANGVSLLSTVTMTGHDGADTESLPALEVSYSTFEPVERDFIAITGTDLTARSLAHADLELVDLFGQGLPDLLEMNGQARYWRNLGGTFDLPRPMHNVPAGLKLGDPAVQLIDADGDGRTDLMVTRDAWSGYFPLRFGGLWDERSFRRHGAAPSFNLKDPDVRLVDLDGNGVIDAVRFGTRVECFFNDPIEGWHRTRFVERRALDDFPNVDLSDPRVRWADVSGDGLMDIVLIHDGSVEYWPNLGYGNWGRRVHMHHGPALPFRYDPRRLLVGDVDGDGLADIVYVDDTSVTLWVNIGGNAWSEPIRIRGTPPVSDVDSVRLADMLGNGVIGVLWSSNTGQAGHENLHFLDFTGGNKPYLLNEVDNHIGATTWISYAPSTRYFLEDQKSVSTRWRTTLPFPVQVVARVDVVDELSGGKMTTRYRYHNGYWDGAERDFCGFAMVEQLDSETFEAYHNTGPDGMRADFAPISRPHFSPPTITRTWFHQGAVGDDFGAWQELDWSNQYWAGDASQLGHTESVNQFLKDLPAAPHSRRAKRDALRALRGRILRSELYAADGSIREDRPYTVVEYSYGLREEPVPDVEGERQRIYFPHLLAERTTQWERGNDPLTRFAFWDDYDAFGQPRTQTSIACPRGWRSITDRPGENYLSTRSTTSFGSPTDPTVYIHDRPTQAVSHQLTDTSGRTLTEIRDRATAGVGLEITAHAVHFYDGAAFVGLPFGQVGRLGAPVRSETLALTERQLERAYDDDRPPYLTAGNNAAWPARYPGEFRSMLAPAAGYVWHSAPPYTPGLYVLAQRRGYDFHDGGEGRGLVTRLRDQLGNDTVITYDSPYQLLRESVTDAVGLSTRAVQDYRLLQPNQVIGPNGNVAEATFTPLGFIRRVFTRGKNGEGDGESPSITFDYQLHAFEQSPPAHRQPAFIQSTMRVHHDTDADVPLPDRDALLEKVEYSDGFGRLLQTRAQTSDVSYGDDVFGAGPLLEAQSTAPGELAGRRRSAAEPVNVLVSGAQVFDNKGRPVETCEPFLSSGWQFRSAAAELELLGRDVHGNRTTNFYDGVGRPIRVLRPDGSEQRVVVGVPGSIAAPSLDDPARFEPTPWETYTYDANDNAGRTHPAEALSYAHHWNTPTSSLTDALGRTVEATVRNRDAPAGEIDEFRTRSRYDINGNLMSVTDTLGRQTFRYAYDCAKHRLRAESIDDGVRRSVVDAAGLLVEQTDDKGAWLLLGYDRLHRQTRLWARDNRSAPLGLRIRTEFGDGGTAEQPVAERNAQRAANRLGKLFKQYDEAGLIRCDQYDFRDNLVEQSRQAISDAAILSAFSMPTPDWRVTPYRADWQPPNGVTLEELSAKVLENAEYRTSIRHDALRRVKHVTYPRDVEGNRRSVAPQFNAAGLLERVLVDGEAYVQHIDYNAKGQCTLIAYGNGTLSMHAYEPSTSRLRRSWSGRYATVAATVPTYRPQNVTRPLQDLAYEYDLVGNILKIADRTPGSGVLNSPSGPDAFDRIFSYDAAYRLRSATGRESLNIPAPRPWPDAERAGFNSAQHGTANQDNAPQLTRRFADQYQYDPTGNLLSMRHVQNAGTWVRRFGVGGYTPQEWQSQWVSHFGVAAEWANPPNNRLTHVGEDQPSTIQTHFYDPNGNLLHETSSRHLEWDHSDRLTSFRVQAGGSEPSAYTHYLYDAAGQRVKKLIRRQGGGVDTTVYVDSLFEHHRRVRVGSVIENDTVHVMDERRRIASRRIGGAFADDSMPSLTFQLEDHLGSSSVLVGELGNWINREEYTPYGETTFGSVAFKRYRFTGKERDGESGLGYHGARYYAPHLLRWCSPDPAGVSGGVNPFVYCAGNPVGRVDPSGLESVELEQTYTGASADIGMEYRYWESDKVEVLTPADADKSEVIRFNNRAADSITVKPPFSVQVPGTAKSSYKFNEHPQLTNEERWQRAQTMAKLDMESRRLELLQGFQNYEDFKAHAMVDMSMFVLTEGIGAGAGALAVRVAQIGEAGSLAAPAAAGGSRAFGFSVLDGSQGLRVGVRITENAYSFNTPVDELAVRKLLTDIETKNPGAGVYVGSGGHGGTYGSYFGSDLSMAESDFLLEDIESVRSLQQIGVGRVLDLAQPAELQLFRNAERMALQPGQTDIFTIRAWCFSSRTRLIP